jgi:outer membrane protein assembly factor BamA
MTTHPRVVSATATEVILEDCTVENSMEYDAANKPVDPANGVRTSFRVTVDNVGGTWKVAHFDRRSAPCDPA